MCGLGVTYLVFGQQSVADARQQHHGHQEGHGGASRHCGWLVKEKDGLLVFRVERDSESVVLLLFEFKVNAADLKTRRKLVGWGKVARWRS